MKSNKQRRQEIKRLRARKQVKREKDNRKFLVSVGRLVPVNPQKLDMGNSWACPPSFYKDEPFDCIDCGAQELWTAKQQKWWFEEIGALYHRKAVRCRPCRIKERIRKTEARRVHAEGILRKQQAD